MDFRIFFILSVLSLTITADFRQSRLNQFEVTGLRHHQDRGQHVMDERRGRSFVVVGNDPNQIFRELTQTPHHHLHHQSKMGRALTDTMEEKKGKKPIKKHHTTSTKIVGKLPNFPPLPPGSYVSMTGPMNSQLLPSQPQTSSLQGQQGHLLNGQKILVHPNNQTPFPGHQVPVMMPMQLNFASPSSSALPLPQQQMTQPKFTLNSNSLSVPTPTGHSKAKPKFLYVVNNVAIPVPQTVQPRPAAFPVNSVMGQSGQSPFGHRQERTFSPMMNQVQSHPLPQNPRMLIQSSAGYQPINQQVHQHHGFQQQGQGQMSGQFGGQWPQQQMTMTPGNGNPVRMQHPQLVHPIMPQFVAQQPQQPYHYQPMQQNPQQMQFPFSGQRVTHQFPTAGMPTNHYHHVPQMTPAQQPQPSVNSEETRGHEKRQADWPSVDHQVVLDIFKLYDYLGQTIGSRRR